MPEAKYYVLGREKIIDGVKFREIVNGHAMPFHGAVAQLLVLTFKQPTPTAEDWFKGAGDTEQIVRLFDYGFVKKNTQE